MMTKGKHIASGRMAEVYAWGDSHVLKLFRDWCHPGDVDYELRLARAVQATGLAVPRVEERIVEIDGRHGIVYERIDGPTMARAIMSRPWTIIREARAFATLHAAMHSRTVSDLPAQRERLESKIRQAAPLSEAIRQTVLKRLSQLPDGDALCHGDFHPGNILLSSRGPIVIDWIDAASGHPLADVARTLLLLDHGRPPGISAPMRTAFEWLRAVLRDAYLKHYCRVCRVTREQIDAWRLPVAAGRLSEGIKEEESRLVAIVEAELSRH